MIIFTRGTATIEHSESKDRFEIHNGDLEWEAIGGDERGMGEETIYEAIVDHDELGELRWTISEYPAELENFKETDVGTHVVVSDFDYGLEHEPEFDESNPITLRDRLKENPKWAVALTRGTLVKLLVGWFHYLYEDPANETPYNGREGGYLYIKGGPYNAEEELRDSFEDVVPEDAIMTAVDEIQNDGFDWAPSPNHQASIDFYEEAEAEQDTHEDLTIEALQKVASERTSIFLDSEEELVARVELVNQITTLKNELPKPPSYGGMGHNHPPEEFELSGNELEMATESLNSIEAELSTEQPNAEVVATKASFLKQVVGWVAGKLDKTFDEFCKGFGSTLGKAAGVALPAAIVTSPYWEKIATLLGSLKGWLLLVLGI